MNPEEVTLSEEEGMNAREAEQWEQTHRVGYAFGWGSRAISTPLDSVCFAIWIFRSVVILLIR